MKKLLTIFCLSFIFGVGNVYADESSSSSEESSSSSEESSSSSEESSSSTESASSVGEAKTYAVKYNSEIKRNEIWEVKSDGTNVKLIDFEFPSGFWTPATSYASNKTGKIYLKDSGYGLTEEEKGWVVYDPATNTLTTGVKEGYHEGYQKVFSDVLKIDSLIRSDDGSSIHIGENSLVTVEENGVQQLYATDANGDMININIKKGTDLLIDGVSVSGSLNTNATNIATNSTNIATNKTNIATNTTDIATNVTNIAANTAEIATNVTNIAANTAEIATHSTSIASNTTAIAALGSDLSAFKASTNSQMNYMKSDYSSGIASAIAMSQFNLAQDGFSVGIGRGSYNDEDETAFGLGYGGEFKNGTLFKLQASKSGDASGVGLTISF